MAVKKAASKKKAAAPAKGGKWVPPWMDKSKDKKAPAKKKK